MFKAGVSGKLFAVAEVNQFDLVLLTNQTAAETDFSIGKQPKTWIELDYLGDLRSLWTILS